VFELLCGVLGLVLVDGVLEAAPVRVEPLKLLELGLLLLKLLQPRLDELDHVLVTSRPDQRAGARRQARI
jgi:hypothetical protein